MGMFERTESDYYRISGQDHCKLQELEFDFKNEAIQEVMMISSLQDLSNEQTPPRAIATSGTQYFNASQVLERMKHAAPDIARDLALKMDAKSKAPFRLITECQDRKGWTSTKPTQPESFIALSYCWHNDS